MSPPWAETSAVYRSVLTVALAPVAGASEAVTGTGEGGAAVSVGVGTAAALGAAGAFDTAGLGWLCFCHASQSIISEKVNTSSRTSRRLSIADLFVICSGGGATQGTGSKPPGCQGWQRPTRFMASQTPRAAPWRRNASIAYSAQLGWKRQLLPSHGLMASL